ncbi:MAG: short chain dehydrogenase [Bacteroidetes bacterium HGW-Bacteroidetes-4]|jgi:short-subunit dehydrogenase|nr:MAG: short chain dehydrogenase [Bacteroidetes bacterium HGW-Bacteroidetes-4]
MYQFKNKVVIITGASSGIGKAFAYEFAKKGAILSLAARRIDLLKQIKLDLEASGTRVLVQSTDVTSEADCKRLIENTAETFGGIDILINNAGISMRSLFSDVDLKVLKQLMEVNFWGAVYCTKYALPYLLKSKGVLVGVSSVAGFHGLPGRTGYSASKFALHGFLETLRIEHLKDGLHVLVIAPGFTASEIRKNALISNGSPQGITPRDEQKMMTPQKVARILIRSIRKKKRNKIISFSGQLIALMQRILPEQVDAMIYRIMSKEVDSPFK